VSARPTHTTLRLTNRGRSPSVERALTDFGAEESFARAAKRFKEHYGWEIGRTTVLRVVEQRAHDAERYVAERLQEASLAYQMPLQMRPGVDEMLVELDGCEIRTGTLVAADTGEKSEVRGLDKRKRNEEWRDIRVGIARPMTETTRTYVAAMADYDIVTDQLFAAAVDRGLSERTQVVGVADGGNGLREALDAKFAGMRFILDRPHFKTHLYETADAMGLVGDAREEWVAAAVDECEVGKATVVVETLRDFEGTGDARVHCLANYLDRFSDAVDYENARASGYPTGSGEVESAHRYVPQKRLKIPGACWAPDTINPMLALRVMRENEWWDDFWAAEAPHVAIQCRATGEAPAAP
jgi:hypothetical protein